MIVRYGLPEWIVVKNPSLVKASSDSNMTNKELPELEIIKLPKFPLSLSLWVDWSFDPSYIVTESDTQGSCSTSSPTYKKNSKSISICETKPKFHI